VYKRSYDKSNLDVWIDLCTFCNAGCPQCHRTSSQKNGEKAVAKKLDKVDWLPLIQWDLKKFKKAFPIKIIQRIPNFYFCGTWGDPIMCKDIAKICKYIINSSDNSKICINTNGSIRDVDWWWDLGAHCKKRLTIIFDVDGINQEMHSKYRQNTNLKKILSNIESISSTPARILIHVIVFKHNQNYLEDIAKMVRSHGVHKKIIFEMSSRFKNDKHYFINGQDELDYLEKAIIKEKKRLNISGEWEFRNENGITIMQNED
jgi:MoaA/NifB/PqqE/SkfB family radical SAM enzyme